MKNYSWDLPESEKKRILNLHESATKKHYIKEVEGSEGQRVVFPGIFDFRLKNEKMLIGQKNLTIDGEPLTGVLSNNEIIVDTRDRGKVKIPLSSKIYDGNINYNQDINPLCGTIDCNSDDKTIFIPSYSLEGGVRPYWVVCSIDDNGKITPIQNIESPKGIVK